MLLFKALSVIAFIASAISLSYQWPLLERDARAWLSRDPYFEDATAILTDEWPKLRAATDRIVHLPWLDPFVDLDKAARRSDLLSEERKGTPIFLVVTGQSNVLGTRQPASPIPTDPGILVWAPANAERAGRWVEAGPSEVRWPFSDFGGEFWYAGARYLRRWTGRPVHVVMIAAGGQSIAEWLPRGAGLSSIRGRMYAYLYENVAAAVATPELSRFGITEPDLFWMHQGEADADGRSGNWRRYRSAWMAFKRRATEPNGDFADVRLIGPRTVIVLGEVFGGVDPKRPFQGTRNPDIRWIARFDPAVRLARVQGLRAPDNVHFDARSLMSLGYRYALLSIGRSTPPSRAAAAAATD